MRNYFDKYADTNKTVNEELLSDRNVRFNKRKYTAGKEMEF